MKTNLALIFTLTLSGVAQAGTTDILNPAPMPIKGWMLVKGVLLVLHSFYLIEI